MIKRYLQIIFILIPTIIVSCGLANSKNQGELADPDISIGTKEYIWEDANRLDIYYGDTRKINVRIWYPAENINNEK